MVWKLLLVFYGRDEYINELIIINIYDINYKPGSQ